MANVYATKTGNWSDTTVWNTGSLPTSSDDVYANTYTVTIDQNVTVLSLRTTSATGITAGGGFACSTARTIIASGTGILAGTTTCLACSNASGVTMTIQAAITGSASTGSAYGASITGDGGVNITGAVTGGASTSGADAHGINISGAATVNITGNVSAGPSGSNRCRGITVTAPATITITGNITGQNGGNNPDGLSVSHSSGTVTLTVTGTVAGSSNNPTTSSSAINGIGLTTGATLQLVNLSITGSIVANGAVGCSFGGGTTATVTGPFISGATGRVPYGGIGVVKLSPIATTEYRFLNASGGTTSLYSAEYGGQAAPADVRYGTTYGIGGALTGTLRVPDRNSVAYGALVDNTTGLAWLAPSDVSSVIGAAIAAALDSVP